MKFLNLSNLVCKNLENKIIKTHNYSLNETELNDLTYKLNNIKNFEEESKEISKINNINDIENINKEDYLTIDYNDNSSEESDNGTVMGKTYKIPNLYEKIVKIRRYNKRT